MENLISVIVAVYNTEEFLDRCIRSIQSQTYKNLEIILVDDGSTDKSGIICDEYEKKDDRIVVIHQKNAGPAAARNKGLDACTGDWIGFIDADDEVEPDFYKTLLNDAIKNETLVAGCPGLNVRGGRGIRSLRIVKVA